MFRLQIQNFVFIHSLLAMFTVQMQICQGWFVSCEVVFRTYDTFSCLKLIDVVSFCFASVFRNYRFHVVTFYAVAKSFYLFTRNFGICVKILLSFCRLFQYFM